MVNLIRQIKYNRSVTKFIDVLDNLDVVEWGDYEMHSYNKYAIFEIYICNYTRTIKNHIRIFISIINNHLFYGLENDTIINIIDKRYNHDNLPIMID